MRRIMLTTVDRIRRLSEAKIEELNVMQRDMVAQGKSEQQILSAVDEFLDRHGIPETEMKED